MGRWGKSRYPSQWGAGQDPARLPLLSAMAQPEEEEWRHSAACAVEDPELFFPIGQGPDAMDKTEEAKAVCRRCPVADDCLRFALEAKAEGIWGGLTEAERKNHARRRPRRRA